MNVDIDKLEELAKAADPECAWPFYEAAFRKQVTPATLLALIAELRQAREAKAVGAVPDYKIYAVIDSMGWVLDDVEKDDMHRLCTAMIAALASSPALPEQGWISVDERFPEDGEHVLVRGEGGDLVMVCWLQYMDGKPWNWNAAGVGGYEWEMDLDTDPFSQYDRITRWMPLPPPAAKEQEKQNG